MIPAPKNTIIVKDVTLTHKVITVVVDNKTLNLVVQAINAIHTC